MTLDWDHANTIFYYFITHLGVFRKAENCLWFLACTTCIASARDYLFFHRNQSTSGNRIIYYSHLVLKQYSKHCFTDSNFLNNSVTWLFKVAQNFSIGLSSGESAMEENSDLVPSRGHLIVFFGWKVALSIIIKCGSDNAGKSWSWYHLQKNSLVIVPL